MEQLKLQKELAEKEEKHRKRDNKRRPAESGEIARD
jgi:hypothetical protein